MRIDKIIELSEQALGHPILSARKLMETPTCFTYILRDKQQRYLFKLFNREKWPEKDKLVTVKNLLAEKNIICQAIHYYNHEPCEDFYGGYLIEDLIESDTVSHLSFDPSFGNSLYRRVTDYIKDIHQIKLPFYGYFGADRVKSDTYTGFLDKSFRDRCDFLLREALFNECRLEQLKRELLTRLRDLGVDSLPSVLNHGDIHNDNISITRDDQIFFTTWDGAIALPWINDLAFFTLRMLSYYPQMDAHQYREIILNTYCTKSEKRFFKKCEPLLHILFTLSDLNIHIGMPHYDTLYQFLLSLLESAHIKF